MTDLSERAFFRFIASSILRKNLLVTLLLLFLAIVPSSIYFVNTTRNMLFHENLMRLKTLASSLGQNSREAMLSWDFTLLVTISTNVLSEADVLSLTIFNSEGRILGDSVPERVGTDDLDVFNEIVSYAYPPGEDAYVVYQTNNMLEIRRRVHVGDRLVGAVALGVSLERINVLVAATTLRIVMISAAILLFGTIVAILFVQSLTRSIKSLQLGARTIGAGDLAHRITVTSVDEIGELAHAFNEMAGKMQESMEQLDAQNLELKELDRMKSEFLANTSHELRTPLNGIIGLVDAVLDGADGPLNTEQEKHLQMVSQCSQNLLSLVNDLLDLSKLEAGLMEFDIQRFNFTDVVDSVIPIAEGLLKNKPEVVVEFHLHSASEAARSA